MVSIFVALAVLVSSVWMLSGASQPVGSRELIIPVVGVHPDQLRDTFNEVRSEGRAHHAIDIPAAHGTPVLAAAAGQIAKLAYSERGGMTIYQLSSDSKLVYYYAHLDRYADGLTEGHPVRRGQVIGYVGATGNAGAGNYHLHFAMWIVVDPKQYWRGINVNPYPLLRGVSHFCSHKQGSVPPLEHTVRRPP